MEFMDSVGFETHGFTTTGQPMHTSRCALQTVLEIRMLIGVRKPHAAADEDNIPNPCWTQGIAKEVEIPQANGEKNLVLTVGRFDSCKRALELVLTNDACRFSRCIFVC